MLKTMLLLVSFCVVASEAIAEQWVPMGAGKILVGAKPGHEVPKDADYRTEMMKRRALPTNSWFSSLTYMQWSGVLHAHPLSFRATEAGFEMGLPEKAVEPIEAIKAWAWPPPPGRPKASVVHRHVPALTVKPKNFQPSDAKLAAKGDWTISIDMAEKESGRRLEAHIGHGIPYGFFEISDGAVGIDLEQGGAWDEVIRIIDTKQVLYGAVRGVTYAAYFPLDAVLAIVDKRRLDVTLAENSRYFSMAAVLDEYQPQNTGATASRGSKNKDNASPVFAQAMMNIMIDPTEEKILRVGATDTDGDTLTYSVRGPDADMFEIISGNRLVLRRDDGLSSSGLRQPSKNYRIQIVADDGNGGIATQDLTVGFEKKTGQKLDNDYVTLDWETSATGTNTDWVFGGAMARLAQHDNANVLRFYNPDSAEDWAGITLIEAAGGTDLIADRSDPVRMRVWAELNGVVTLVMEDMSSILPGRGATRYLSVTQAVSGGQWNDLAFDFSAPTSATSEAHTLHNKLVMRVDEGNTLFVDQLDLVGAQLAPSPQISATTDLVPPSAEIADLMARHAFAFVTGSRVIWEYSELESRVKTRYAFEVTPADGIDVEPLVGLYPHHWMQLVPGTKLSDYSLSSVRGPIRMMAAYYFETELPFGGLLPTWPVSGSEDELRDLGDFLTGDIRRTASLYTGHGNGTYWTGKALGSIAQLILVSEQLGQDDRAEALEAMLKARMEKWFRGEGGFYFGYHRNVGTLVGYPEEYFSASGMNDHHFHYGYWLMAAAHIAKRDPGWLAPDQWGKMVDLIMRDVATSQRNRDDFPFIRNFDPYEGHSWARGNSDFYGHGNDQESSSEAINAWAALAFLGEFTGNKEVRDLGVYLYTTEIASVLNYWFDIHGIVFDPEYPKPIASMVFGGGYGYSIFSLAPEIT